MTDPGSEVVAPSREDPLLAALSERAGGPLGDHARPHWWWTPARVLLVGFLVVFALGLVQRQPCMKTDWNNTSVRYAKMCYSDIPYLYTQRGYAEQDWPYSDTHGRYQPSEYPVGVSYLAWVAAKITALTPGGPSAATRAETDPLQLSQLKGMDDEVNVNFGVNAILLFLCGIAATLLLAGTHRRRPWDALPFVLSPCLLVTGLVNWDLFAVAFTAGALWAWSRGKPLLSGVLIGLGTATKLYPLLLLGALLVTTIRRRRLSWFGWAVLGTAGAWLVVNLPVMLTGLHEWKYFWKFNASRPADLGSLWYLLAEKGKHFSTHDINATSAGLFVVACAAIMALGLVAKRPPRVAQLAYLTMLAFLIVNKVYSPQYVLWLLPLAVLARPRWRDLLIWQACELFYFAAVWWQLGHWLDSSTTGAGSPIYLVAIVVRVLGELFLAAVVIRDILRPAYDPVRNDGVTDDPLMPPRSPAGQKRTLATR